MFRSLTIRLSAAGASAATAALPRKPPANSAILFALLRSKSTTSTTSTTPLNSTSTSIKTPASTSASVATDPNQARMLIGFTCNVCKHRQHKTMSKQAYTKGVVLIQCDSCKNRHLIADNLGWFRDKSINVQNLMREKGEDVRYLSSLGLLDNIEAEQVNSALSEYSNNTSPQPEDPRNNVDDDDGDVADEKQNK
ncbi:DNL zinc finger-domain-containing protein [Kickxella alabastrina]|uniref:DNL zinc finger-domain-containing protein n=1 Tax=Kickxella alabastrina TaxID=61397 RepID=UPI0022208823|nr:DNL zinc finger-domain-containing protein [Kickxella alabastrina]KAI7829149.1 DNL zinc finger-domain-containing protein [Kickxella alabastrina]KAJ1941124.1 hypothetical protein GGF37_003689 [Kickxella alabastrina]